MEIVQIGSSYSPSQWARRSSLQENLTDVLCLWDSWLTDLWQCEAAAQLCAHSQQSTVNNPLSTLNPICIFQSLGLGLRWWQTRGKWLENHEADLVLPRGLRRLHHQDDQSGRQWWRGQCPQVFSSAGRIFSVWLLDSLKNSINKRWEIFYAN